MPKSSRKKSSKSKVILDVKKPFKKVGVRTQELHRRRSREKLKRDYIGKRKLSKENKKLLSYVKKYKSAVAKKYNIELAKAMKSRAYFSWEIKWAKKFSLVGKNVQVAWDKVPIEKYSADGKRGKVKGKWLSKKKINNMYKRVIKAARIKSYQDILGVSKEKAKGILKIIDKNLPGVNELKALIY